MAEIDKLVVRVEADLAPLRRALRQGEGDIARSAGKMRAAFSGLDQAAEAALQRIAGLGGASAGLAAAGGLGPLVTTAIRAADVLDGAAKAQAAYDAMMAEARALTSEVRAAQEAYADQLRRVQGLLGKNAAMEATAGSHRAKHKADLERASHATDDFTIAVENMATAIGTELEDAIVNAGESVNSFRDIVRALEKDIIRTIARLTVTKPLENALTGAFGSGGGFDPSSFFGQTASTAASSSAPLIGSFAAGFTHKGGRIGAPGIPHKTIPALAFAGAPRLHGGGIVGVQPNLQSLGLRANERPIIAEVGETVVPKGRSPGGVVININLPQGSNAREFRESAAYTARRVADEIDRRAKFR